MTFNLDIGDYRLIDVELAPDALTSAIRWLDVHPDVGAVAPYVARPDGTGLRMLTSGGRETNRLSGFTRDGA